jgi:hypothetical protein
MQFVAKEFLQTPRIDTGSTVSRCSVTSCTMDTISGDESAKKIVIGLLRPKKKRRSSDRDADTII